MRRQEQAHNPVAVLLGSLVVVVIVASVIGTLAATGRFGGSRGSIGGGILGSPVNVSTLATAQLLCPSGATFSPNGAELAVIGSTYSCHSAPYDHSDFNAHVMALFDAHLGTLQRTISLDPLVGYDRYTPRAAQRIRAIRYVGMGWTPEGKSFAVAYATFGPSTDISFENVVDSGLLVVDTTTGRATTIKGDAGFFSPTGATSGYPIWNLDQHTVTPPATVATGLTYTWTDNGELRPVAPLSGRPLSRLPVSAGSRYPVGDPDGDSTFTLWQPGILLGPGVISAGQGRDVFVAAFPSWSVNGAFTTLLLTGAAIAVPASDQMPSSALTGATPPAIPLPAALPAVPARDAALTAVAAAIGSTGWALVAWNPSGSLLASVNCSDAHGPLLEVRDAGTGNVVGTAQVPLPAGEQGCRDFNAPESLGDYPAPDEMLRWSPDGRTLLVCDERASTLALWHVSGSQSAD